MIDLLLIFSVDCNVLGFRNVGWMVNFVFGLLLFFVKKVFLIVCVVEIWFSDFCDRLRFVFWVWMGLNCWWWIMMNGFR